MEREKGRKKKKGDYRGPPHPPPKLDEKEVEERKEEKSETTPGGQSPERLCHPCAGPVKGERKGKWKNNTLGNTSRRITQEGMPSTHPTMKTRVNLSPFCTNLSCAQIRLCHLSVNYVHLYKRLGFCVPSSQYGVCIRRPRKRSLVCC